MTNDLCQCPKCGRMHRDLGFGKPPASISELPDDIRVPLHELQADVDYMVGRMIDAGNSAPIITETIKAKLAALEAAIQSRAVPQGALDRKKIADAAEIIILRRLHEKKIEGYTLPMSWEIAHAIVALSRPHRGSAE